MPRPVSEISAAACRAFRLIASDIDDTMTTRGRLDVRTIELLVRAQDAGLPVLVVTGRPAGFVMSLAAYMPLAGVIAENGGALAGHDGCTILPAGGESIDGLRGRLDACRRDVLAEAPEARVSGDSFARLTDLAFVVEGMARQTRAAIDRNAARHGFVTVASSIHVHVKLAGHTKGRALAAWLRMRDEPIDLEHVLTVGDSETDQTLFDTSVFPHSVGVANIAAVLARLKSPPAYVTERAEGEGFRELLELVLRHRAQVP